MLSLSEKLSAIQAKVQELFSNESLTVSGAGKKSKSESGFRPIGDLDQQLITNLERARFTTAFSSDDSFGSTDDEDR